MTASPLFSKKPPPPVLVRPASDLDRLSQWVERGRQQRFLIEAVVTPEMAAWLLSRNAENRVASTPTVETYAAAMRRGEWSLNGQNIIIADTGDLNDGQHRLLAVIDADMPVAMGLQFGVTRESRATLDVGRKRTLGDHLAMAGHINSIALAATVRLAWCYDAGLWSFSQSPSVEQAMDYIARHPTLADYLRPGKRIGSEFGASGSQFSFAGFVCSRVSASVAGELMSRVEDGLGLATANVPAARVRERMLQHLTGKTPLRRHEAAAIFIKAFNAAMAGRRMRPLSWAPTGPQAEDFPVAGA